MGRLIDADEAYKVLTDYYHQRTEIQHKALKEALSRVPTVDPVKHGYWKIIQEYYMECSVCKTRIDKRDLEWAMDVDADYCPHCGSKMDEVENE